MADEKIKISALAQGTPQENDIIPYVDLATNTTKKALKSELKGVQGDAATVDAGTTTTLPAGQSATVINVGTTAAAIFNFAIPQGIQGLTGSDGACVESVAFVGNDMVFTLDDNSTVTLTNAKTDLKGDTGLTGAKITSASFVGDDLVFVLDDTSTVTVTGAKTDLKGDTGLTGETGATGKGITSITKTGTVGLVDTYTITYTDETTATFNVTNGEDGADGTNGTNGTDGDDGISFIWKGAYVAETAYQVNDVVSYNGSTYICILISTGNLPTNATYWSLMAQKGADGLGSGDMLASVYDPNSVVGDAFDMDNMAQGDTNLFVSSTEKSTWNGKQDSLGFTPEDVSNKVTSISGSSTDTQYPSAKLVYDQLAGKQASGSYEVTTNKETSALDTSTTKYPCNNVVKSAVDAKASLTGTETLTNKRINPRLVTAASYTTDTGTSLDVSTCDQFEITAQAGDLKFNNPSGTPVGGQALIIRIKDDGTARALTYDTQFRVIGTILPTTTVINKTLYMGFIYNATDTKWDCVAVVQE